MITADYRGKGGVQNGQKSEDVICERSLSGGYISHTNRRRSGTFFNDL